jgi:hypothetical protein
MKRTRKTKPSGLFRDMDEAAKWKVVAAAQKVFKGLDIICGRDRWLVRGKSVMVWVVQVIVQPPNSGYVEFVAVYKWPGIALSGLSFELTHDRWEARQHRLKWEFHSKIRP